MLPFAAIRAGVDRSYTAPLLALLGRGDDAQRDEVVWTLEILRDPRAVEPLTRLLLQRESPPEARQDAARILGSWGDPPDGPTLRRWWAEGDPPLQRHALLCMGRECADIVGDVASRADHPHHLQGVATMVSGFEEPRFQELKIRALSHPSAAVRRTAADVLLWDEPASAEEPLLRRLTDEAEPVAAAAAETLRYYPTRRCVEALAGLLHRPGELCEKARASLSGISASARGALERLEGDPRSRLLDWVAPLQPWLELSEEGPAAPPGPPAPQQAPSPSAAPPLDELLEAIACPDGAWQPRLDALRRLRSGGVAPRERPRVREALLGHPDPEVRCVGAGLLADWGERDALLALLGDGAFSVRKSAVYQLGRLPADPRVAEAVWEHLHRPATAGTHAYETLETWLVHADRPEALRRLPALILAEERESVRCHAVHGAARLRAAAVLQEALPELLQVPRVSWGVHLALLEAASALRLPLPEGSEAFLGSVDHLDVQAAVARCCARSSR